ncbi:MAG TPA: carbohydrate ABC transporter permease [Candidatus Fraserbacteria bacterium]|nr:carbohydrate ABC transporter permease [Candidatus Fraserbacteria bacterium]
MIAKLLRTLERGPLHLVIILIGFLWLLPTVGLLISSFRPEANIIHSGWWTVFAHPFNLTQYTIENYQKVLINTGIWRSFLNSLKITIPATIIPVILASFAAYAFAWMKFRGRNLLFLLVVGLIVVPLQMTFIPVLQIYAKLHFSGTYWGLWLAHTGYGLPLLIYMLRNFMGGLPQELFESAFLDGASHFAAFTRLVLPLSVPAIAAMTIFQFLWVWNDLIVALIYVGGSPRVAPLTLTISNLIGSYGEDWQLLTAAAFISMIVPLIVFLSLQRYFVRGILAGSIKG